MKQPYYFRGDITYPVSVLVVTDSYAEVLRIRRRLESHNCRVHRLDPRSSRVAVAGHRHVDLIVVDTDSPAVNSRELCRRLKNDPELARVPLLLLTSGNKGQDFCQNFEMKADFSVSKDSVRTCLLQIVEEIRYLIVRYL